MEGLRDRAAGLIRDWGVEVESARETGNSLLVFGESKGRAIVLKVIRNPGEEWSCGRILEAFGGHGMVRAFEHVPGAVLMDRLSPGTQVIQMVRDAGDEEAIEVIAGVIAAMRPEGPADAPRVEDWAKSFEEYLGSEDARIERSLVEKARDRYGALCRSQTNPRLLHGDLHHENVLWDRGRGWLAIDPKGVIGEVEYEIGAAMRNPHEFAERFVPKLIEQRLRRFAAVLPVNQERALGWAFSEAVLAAIWEVEDGGAVSESTPALMLARALLPIL